MSSTEGLLAALTAGAASAGMSTRDLVSDHFFLAGYLGPGCFQTRSWSFRSKNRLVFMRKQSTPVLLAATSTGSAEGRTHRLPQLLRHPHSGCRQGWTPGTSQLCPSRDTAQHTQTPGSTPTTESKSTGGVSGGIIGALGRASLSRPQFFLY